MTRPGNEELMGIRAATMFVLEARGRLVSTNEARPRPAPAVYLGRHDRGVFVHVRADLGDEAAAAITRFASGLPAFDGAPLPAAACQELARLAGCDEPPAITAGPAFAFTGPLVPETGAMPIYPANVVLLHPQLATWTSEDLQAMRPAFAVFRNRQAVALCASSRTSAAACEAGVETAPDFRGRGLAALAVEAWAAAIRKQLKLPFYSTSWENAASQAVARKLDLELIGEDISIA